MRRPGPRLLPDARLRRAVRAAADPLHGGRRPALLRARRDPRRPRLSAADPVARTTTWPSSASSTRPSAASATPRVQKLLQLARAERRLGRRSPRAGWSAPTSCRPAPARRWPTSSATSTAGARWPTTLRHPRADGDGAGGERLHRRAPRRPRARSRQGRLENLKELVQSMGQFDTLQAYLEHVSLVMDLDRGARRRRGADHDPALGQGAGVPAGLPARLGGRRLPLPALHGREGREGARGGAPPGLRRHHPGARGGAHLLRRQPAGLWPLDQPAAQPLRRRAAARQRRGRRPRPATTAAAPACSEAKSAAGTTQPGFGAGYTSPGWRRAQDRAATGGSHRAARRTPGHRGRRPPGRHLRPRRAGRRLQARRPRLPP